MNSGFNLVRWIMVVTLGCSLGLLLIFVVVSTRPVRVNEETGAEIYRVQPQEPPLKLSEETMETELRRVIESQLAAFRQDDYPRAYNYAASAIKAQLPLPAFERMVKSGYPLMARSRTVRFGVVLDNGEQAMVNATITDEAGRSRHYQYLLERERAGWKIRGVTEVKFEGTTI